MRDARPRCRRRVPAAERIVVAEQPIERVGRRQHQQVVRPPPALVAAQQIGGTAILATACASITRSASAIASRKPRLRPCPAIGWIVCAASRTSADACHGSDAHAGPVWIAPTTSHHLKRTESVTELAADRLGRPASSSASMRCAIRLRSVHTMADMLGAPPSSASVLAHMGN